LIVVINAYGIYCLVTTQLEANHALIINNVLVSSALW